MQSREFKRKNGFVRELHGSECGRFPCTAGRVNLPLITERANSVHTPVI